MYRTIKERENITTSKVITSKLVSLARRIKILGKKERGKHRGRMLEILNMYQDRAKI
jgi:hypothetical protein